MKDKESRRGPFTLDSIKSSIGVPLFHAAWLFALGIVIAHYLWLRPAWLLVSLAPIAVLSSVAALRAQRVIWLPLAVLWCSLGAWCADAAPTRSRRRPRNAF